MAPHNTISPAQTYPEVSGSGIPGSSAGPDDLEDNVQASTVNYGFQDMVNGLAYIMALVNGPNIAPGGADAVQPGALSGTSGISRIQNIGFGALPETSPEDNYTVVYVNGYGLYMYFNTQGTADDGVYIINTSTGQWVNMIFFLRGTTQTGSIVSSAGVPYGVAPTDVNGKVNYSIMGAANSAVSSTSTGNFVGSGDTGPDNVTNLTVSITTGGGPILLMCVPDQTAHASFIQIRTPTNLGSDNTISSYSALTVNVTGEQTATINAGLIGVMGYVQASSSISNSQLPSSFMVWYPAAAGNPGTYHFQVQYANDSNDTETSFSYLLLAAIEVN